MKRKDDMIRGLGQVMIIFGVTVFILMVLAIFLGEDAKGYSTIFALGDRGLGLDTLAQFLFISSMIAGLRFRLFSDKMISKVSLALRTFLMFFLVVLIVSLFASVFGWFPVDNLKAWGMFFACFAICSFASAYIMAWKTDRENKEMEEALRKLKEAEQTDEEENKDEK